jgi:hypothetical protein
LNKQKSLTMRRSFYLLLSTLILLLFEECTNSKTELTVNDLTCENLCKPLGIATSTPRFSWKIRSAVNGTSQKACQIIAASEYRLLSENKADLWNSGKVTSGESVLVPWQGKNLSSGLVCCWKVRIWDENDEISEWFYQAPGGIRPDENFAGYSHILIDPQIPEGITWVKASKETPYGTIVSNWKKEGTLLKMDVQIPVGCSAVAAIPTNNETFTINGEKYKSDKPFIELQSGKYVIVYKLNK